MDADGFNQDIGNWDTANVTSTYQMFSSAISFNQDIGGWDTSNVTSMHRMFKEPSSFDQALSGWCVSNISSPPADFATDATNWTLPRPVWGTCP